MAPEGSTIRRRVIASGRVQGVFFRDTIRRRAEAAGVSGWVRNRGDGKVEAAFEGEPEAVESMVELCRRGPGRAEVTDLEVIDEDPEGLSGFVIS
jgi:acylphosphatase